MEAFITAVFVLINLFAFGLYAFDKLAARSSWRRIPEKTLLTVSILGGCFGGMAAMYLLRHKTRKPRFVMVNGVACAVYLVVILILYFS